MCSRSLRSVMSAAVVLDFLMLGSGWTTAQGADALLACRGCSEALVADTPTYIDAHVLLATTYYRLKRKDDERQIVEKLTAEAHAKQPKPERPAAGTGASVPPSPDSRRN
jgi:hypothetical protein